MNPLKELYIIAAAIIAVLEAMVVSGRPILGVHLPLLLIILSSAYLRRWFGARTYLLSLSVGGYVLDLLVSFRPGQQIVTLIIAGAVLVLLRQGRPLAPALVCVPAGAVVYVIGGFMWSGATLRGDLTLRALIQIGLIIGVIAGLGLLIKPLRTRKLGV